MRADSFGNRGKTHWDGTTLVSLRDFVRTLQILCLLLLLALPTSAPAQNVLTQHNDNFRTGANLSESILTVSNINVSQFGMLFSRVVDGQIYAQPLYVSGLMISGQVHNVVYVGTEHDSVYAFDADDPAASNPLWQVSLGTSVPIADFSNCTDLQPEVGITGTPVIDLTSSTMYVVAKTVVGSTHFQQLHALDLVTGQDKFGGPVSIQGSVPGTGAGSSDGILTFDPLYQHSRAGLLLLSNTVYVAFGSHCDYGNYTGWLFGYNATNLQQTTIFCTTPNAGDGPIDGGGGIWGSGMGPAADASGNIYVTTGNGRLDMNTGGVDLGDSLIKLSVSNGTLVVADWFSPHNQANMYTNDLDLGARGLRLYQPEIQDLRPPVARQQDVGRLEIAMHDAGIVRRRQAARDLQRRLNRLAQPQSGAAQRLAIHQFVDDIPLADIVHGNNVRMIQRRHRPRFQIEPLPPQGIVRHFRRQNLQCHLAPQSRVSSAVHLAHTARAERSKNLVGSQPSSGRQGDDVSNDFTVRECGIQGWISDPRKEVPNGVSEGPAISENDGVVCHYRPLFFGGRPRQWPGSGPPDRPRLSEWQTRWSRP